MRFYDAHNHLQDVWLKDGQRDICAQLEALPVNGAVVNGTSQADWADVLGLARRFRWIIPSLGLHPWEVGNRTPLWEDELRRQLGAAPGAAVGEIGLDRWILERARPDDPRLNGLRRAGLDEQLDVFTHQLQIAAEMNRPVTVHCLEAWGALHDALSARPPPPCGFLLHAYGGPAEMVASFVALGAYFSFNGYFLDARKQRQQETFKRVPPERLLIETDAPAMPLPLTWRTHKVRGNPQANHPGNIEAAYTGLAALLGVERAKLEHQVESNFLRLFGRLLQ